jgi:hypothetical protein
MERLFIVVYRNAASKRWTAISEGELPERRMAENFIECKKAAGWSSYEFGIVEGPIVNPEQMAEAEKQLGTF